MRFWTHWGVLACAGLLLAACAGAPRPPPPSTDIDEAVYREHIRVLASDEFEGRKPGTPGEEKTVAYLIDQFRKLGLKPGNGESYLQQVPMVEISAAADAALSVAASKGGTIALGYGKDMVIWTKRALPQAELKRSELVFVGYGIVAPEYAWNDYADLDVHGKTVLVLVNDPGYGTKDPRIFKGGAMTYYGRWAYKVEEAARQGAAGVLLVHDDEAAGYGWNVVLNTLDRRAVGPGGGRRQRRACGHRRLDSEGRRARIVRGRRGSTLRPRRPPRPTRDSRRYPWDSTSMRRCTTAFAASTPPT